MSALADAIDEMVQNLEQEFGVSVTGISPSTRREMVSTSRWTRSSVGAMGLGYDANRDRILLVAQEALAGDATARGPLLCDAGADAGAQPVLARCGRPRSLAGAGHFRPKRTSAATARRLTLFSLCSDDNSSPAGDSTAGAFTTVTAPLHADTQH